MCIFAAFYETRRNFNNFIKHSSPLSFEEWDTHPHSDKAVLLYLEFFDPIILAWTKANSLNRVEGEEGVSTLLQYLEKNVTKIEDEPKRYSPAYIYRVAYNCLYCICHDRVYMQRKWKYEVPECVLHEDGEISLFDTICDEDDDSLFSSYYKAEFEKEFWSVIEDTGESAEKVMRYLLSGDAADLRKISKRSKRYTQGDPLRDVEVSPESIDSILGHIRKKFMQLSHNSPCGEYVSHILAGNA